MKSQKILFSFVLSLACLFAIPAAASAATIDLPKEDYFNYSTEAYIVADIYDVTFNQVNGATYSVEAASFPNYNNWTTVISGRPVQVEDYGDGEFDAWIEEAVTPVVNTKYRLRVNFVGGAEQVSSEEMIYIYPYYNYTAKCCKKKKATYHYWEKMDLSYQLLFQELPLDQRTMYNYYKCKKSGPWRLFGSSVAKVSVSGSTLRLDWQDTDRAPCKLKKIAYYFWTARMFSNRLPNGDDGMGAPVPNAILQKAIDLLGRKKISAADGSKYFGWRYVTSRRITNAPLEHSLGSGAFLRFK